jgi:hypothetical protein
VSALVHAVLLLTVAAAAFIEQWWLAAWPTPATRVIQVTSSRADRPTADPTPKEETPEVNIVSDPADVTGSMVRERIGKVAAEARTRSDAENLDRLDKLSDRLSQVSTPASVDAMSGAMHSMLGTKPRVQEPVKAAPDAVFDFETAQFHDVKRYERPNGGWRYMAVLIDAAGLTAEVELDEDSGQPDLRGVYAAGRVPGTA